MKKITGAYPLIFDDVVLAYVTNIINNNIDECARHSDIIKAGHWSPDDLALILERDLDGARPERTNPYIEEIVSVLDNVYDNFDTHLFEKSNTLSIIDGEEGCLISYLAWLRGGFPDFNGELIPFTKPEPRELLIAAKAIKRMISAIA